MARVRGPGHLDGGEEGALETFESAYAVAVSRRASPYRRAFSSATAAWRQHLAQHRQGRCDHLSRQQRLSLFRVTLTLLDNPGSVPLDGAYEWRRRLRARHLR